MNKNKIVVTISAILIVFLLSFLHVQSAVIPTVNAATKQIPYSGNSVNAPQAKVFRLIVIFAEFPDAKHTVSADEIMKRFFAEMNDYYNEASYGLVSFTANRIKDWIQVPRLFSSYGEMMDTTSSEVTNRIRQLTGDIIKAADDEVDYSKYDRVVIVIPKVRTNNWAYIVSVPTNDGITVIQPAVQHENEKTGVFAHELGHTFGLRDLYDHALANKSAPNDIYMGTWCLMSSVAISSHFCAYNKMALGWIPPERVKVVMPGSFEFITLEPLETKTEGFHVIKIPVTNQSYYLVEIRRKIGFDATLPDEGMLITFVDEFAKGDGFIKVVDANTNTSSLNDATFDTRTGKKNTFTDTSNNLAVIIAWTEGNANGICITTSALSEKTTNLAISISQGISQITTRLKEASKASFKCPQGQALLNEAQMKFASIINSLKTEQYGAASQEINNVIGLIDRAFSVEQKYTEAVEMLSQAKTSILNAESEERTSGLSEAKELLQQSTLALDAREYDEALTLAIKAKKAAETARPAISIYWIIGAACAMAIIAGLVLLFLKKRKRNSSPL